MRGEERKSYLGSFGKQPWRGGEGEFVCKDIDEGVGVLTPKLQGKDQSQNSL